MLAETLGLNNYLLHLDYIDRQILLEQHDGDINKKIEEIINKNKEQESDNGNENDNTNCELQKEMKANIMEQLDVNENRLDKPLNNNNI